MLKVALVNAAGPVSYPQPPLGLALIAAVLEKAGYPVSILDGVALRLSPAELIAKASGADVVGLTAMTPTVSATLEVARRLKTANPKLTVILGGPHVSLLPAETLSICPEIDIAVRGEGEETIIELLRAIEHRQSLENIAGISFHAAGKIIHNPLRSQAVDMDSLPFLAYHLLPLRSYRPHPPHGRSLPFASVVTSRGCPYHCAFCSKPIFGNKYRAQSPQRVADEINYLRDKFGVREIAFYDDVFTLDKKRTHAVADEILKRRLKFDWTCETRVNLVDKELLRHLRSAGCYAIAYGIESASPEMLEKISKGISLEQVEEAVKISREAGLQTIGYFMIGAPGETPETIQQTIRFAKKLRLDFAQFSIATPYPGTELFRMLGERGEDIPWESLSYAGAGNSLSPVFDSASLSRDDLKEWARQAYRQFYLRPAYLWQRISRTRSLGDLKVDFKGLAMLRNNTAKS